MWILVFTLFVANGTPQVLEQKYMTQQECMRERAKAIEAGKAGTPSPHRQTIECVFRAK